MVSRIGKGIWAYADQLHGPQDRGTDDLGPAHQVGNACDGESGEDTGWDCGKEDILELNGEVEVITAAVDAGSDGIVVQTRHGELWTVD